MARDGYCNRRLYLTTGPTELPVSLSEAQSHLRVDSNADVARISMLLQAAVGHLDGPKGLLGRALLTQTWKLTLNYFPWEGFDIPLPPLQSVSSITYLDTDGNTQTLSTDAYLVLGLNGNGPGRVVRAYSYYWPALRDQEEAVTVNFVAGWSSVSDVPEVLKQAIMVLVEMQYDGQEINPGLAMNALQFLIGGYVVDY